MLLETSQAFRHIYDTMTGNAIATLFFAVLGILSLKLVATVAGAVMRDDAKHMEWYQVHVEGRDHSELDAPEKAYRDGV